MVEELHIIKVTLELQVVLVVEELFHKEQEQVIHLQLILLKETQVDLVDKQHHLQELVAVVVEQLLLVVMMLLEGVVMVELEHLTQF